MYLLKKKKKKKLKYPQTADRQAYNASQACRFAVFKRFALAVFKQPIWKQGMFQLNVRDQRFSMWGPGTPGGPQLKYFFYINSIQLTVNTLSVDYFAIEKYHIYKQWCWKVTKCIVHDDIPGDTFTHVALFYTSAIYIYKQTRPCHATPCNPTFTQVHFESRTFTCNRVSLRCNIDTFTQVKNVSAHFTTLTTSSKSATF